MTHIDSDIVTGLIQNIPAGILVLNPRGKIVLSNPALFSVLGLGPDALPQDASWVHLLEAGPGNLAFSQILVDCVDRKKIKTVRDVPYVRPDGQTRRLSVTSSFLPLEDGGMHVSMIVEDVTQKYKLMALEREKALAGQERQRQRAAELQLMALSLAHQIRNPATAIGGLAGLVKARIPASDAKSLSFLEAVQKEALRLENLVRSVVDFASLPPPKPRLVELDDIVTEAVNTLHQLAGAQGREMEFRLTVKPGKITVDPLLFQRALQIILINALDNTPGSPVPVEIMSTGSEQEIRITIKDHGRGIDPQVLPHIFVPFYSSHPERMGMGLCLAQKIIREHDGTIDIASRPGQGTLVTVTLRQNTHLQGTP